MIKVLITGVSGSGKTTLAQALVSYFEPQSVTLLREDFVREALESTSHTPNAALDVAYALNTLVESCDTDLILIDSLCPSASSREIIHPDIIVWMDTEYKNMENPRDRRFQNPPSRGDVLRLKKKELDSNCRVVVSAVKYALRRHHEAKC